MYHKGPVTRLQSARQQTENFDERSTTVAVTTATADFSFNTSSTPDTPTHQVMSRFSLSDVLESDDTDNLLSSRTPIAASHKKSPLQQFGQAVINFLAPSEPLPVSPVNNPFVGKGTQTISRTSTVLAPPAPSALITSTTTVATTVTTTTLTSSSPSQDTTSTVTNTNTYGTNLAQHSDSDEEVSIHSHE